MSANVAGKDHERHSVFRVRACAIIQAYIPRRSVPKSRELIRITETIPPKVIHANCIAHGISARGNKYYYMTPEPSHGRPQGGSSSRVNGTTLKSYYARVLGLGH
jgi:hypothetical protein